MDRLHLRLVAAGFAGALLFTTVACSSSDDTSSEASSGDVADDAASSDEASSDEASSDEASSEGEDDCTADTAAGDEAEMMSGAASVMWTADALSEHATDEATAETTMAFQADGSLSPSELTVSVGEVFAVTGTEEIRALQVGCADAQTIVGSEPAGFYATEPGTYVLFDEAANGYEGAEVGTITAE